MLSSTLAHLDQVVSKGSDQKQADWGALVLVLPVPVLLVLVLQQVRLQVHLHLVLAHAGEKKKPSELVETF